MRGDLLDLLAESDRIPAPSPRDFLGELADEFAATDALRVEAAIAYRELVGERYDGGVYVDSLALGVRRVLEFGGYGWPVVSRACLRAFGCKPSELGVAP